MSGRSCSAARSDFFVSQAEPAQEEQDRGKGRHHDPAGSQFRLDLGQRDAGLPRDQPAEQIGMWLKHRAAMPANPVRREGAGLAHPLQQLHGSRRADLVTRSGLADRTALGH
jgi:hypothetical protein